MKITKSIIPFFAFTLAIVGAFASTLAQQGWYDSNGTTAGGGLRGNITNPSGDSPVCRVQPYGVICTYTTIAGTFPVYATKAAAEAGNAVFILRHN